MDRTLPLLPTAALVAHPALQELDQVPPELPPELDLTLLPDFDNWDQLNYLADYLVAQRHETLRRAFALLATSPPGYTLTAARIGINAAILGKLLGLSDSLATARWRDIPARLQCSKGYFDHARRAILARIRAIHPRTATAIQRKNTAAKAGGHHPSKHK